jgi:hypothetical protein
MAIPWQTISSFVGIVGGILGTISFFRSVWRERSELVVTQKEDLGWHKIDQNLPGSTATLTLTMLVSNRSSRPNAVLRYEGNIVQKDGTKKKLRVEQGQWGRSNSEDGINFHHFGVTPLNVPPFSTVEAVICFLEIDLEKYRYPLSLEITALDMYGKQFIGNAELSM